MTAPDFHTVIVGAGFSGIGTAIQLDKAGLGDYQILEAGEEPGGTWYWNTYPGIAVDIPSFSYQFSFEQSADWSHLRQGRRTQAVRRAVRRPLRPTRQDSLRHDGDGRVLRRRIRLLARPTGRR
ncbi:hypothetical protein JCM12141A_49460 [Mycolicibacterium hodleri]